MRTQSCLVVLLMGIAVCSSAQTVAADSADVFDSGSLGLAGGRWMSHVLSAVPGAWTDGWVRSGWTVCGLGGMTPGQTEILLDDRPFRDPVAGSPDLGEIPASAVQSIKSIRTFGLDGSSPNGGTLDIMTHGATSRSPVTRVVYRSGGGMTDFGVLFGHRSPEKWELTAAMNNQNLGGDNKRSLIRSNVTLWPGRPIELRYALRTGQNDLSPASFQSNGWWWEYAGRLQSDRTDHGASAIFRFPFIDARLDFDRSRMDYRLTNPTMKISGKESSLALRVDKTVSAWSLAAGVESRWRSLDLPDTSGKDRILRAWGRAGWTRGDNQLTFGTTVEKPNWNHQILSVSGLFTRGLPAGVDVWAGWTEGLREPTLGERMGRRPLGWTGAGFWIARDLEQETGRRIEFGARAGRMGKKIDLSVFNQKRDVSGYESRYWGTQARIELKAAHAGFAASISKVGMNGNSPLGAPQWWGHASGYIRHSFFQNDLNVNLGLAVRFWSKYLMSFDALDDTLDTIEPATVLDFKLTAVVMQDFTFALGVENLTGAKAPVFLGISHPVRQVWTGIIWNLYN